MVVRKIYESRRDLLIGQLYKRSNTSVASRAYTCDTLGRPMTRSTSKDGSTVNDSFGYNSRSELNTATVNNAAYAYDYDNIGNRDSAQEAAEAATSYESNQLNQYTTIGDFEPTYDDAGTQTKVKTSIGIWSVIYNAENRPTSFTNADSGTIVECSYDYMGRRATKKVSVNGSVTLYQRFLYRGYLQIACCDLTRSNHPCLWLITWDPMQPIATRPLAIQKDATWYTYGWDLTKNICEVYSQHGYIRTSYTYSPFGQVTASGSLTQPIQWSSEFYDMELGMVYYNWRYFYSGESKWLTRDFIPDSLNPYIYCNNNFNKSDFIGLTTIIFSFLRGDVKKYNQLISLIREHNNKINKWIKKIKDKMINVFKITESCRNGMEMFDWVRRQGVTISWNNQPFNDSYEEFIKKVENDKIVHNSITLGKSETLESLSERLAERANQHDKAVVIGHSLYEQSENTGHFIIPRENSRSEYTSHEYFANFTLITCFMGDNNIRMWDYTEPQKRFALKFTPSTPSGCQHIKSGNIYYIPFDIKPKIIGPIMV